MSNIGSIIMTSDSIHGIEAGIKTATRRVIKPQPFDTWLSYMRIEENGIVKALLNGPDYPDGPEDEVKALYQPNDILWVRETWCKYEPEHVIDSPFAYKANIGPEGERARQQYISAGYPYKWRSPRYMPKEAARCFLLVTNVQVGRLQDISDKDCRAEGVVPPEVDILCNGAGKTYFRKVWDNLNAKRDGGKYAWDKNPWVWVYTFEAIEKPADWPITERKMPYE